MSTTLEILAATERRLQNSIDTCRGLREILEQAEQERDVARAQVQRLREALGKCVVEFEGVARPGQLNVSKSDAANAKMTIQQARYALRETEPHGETEPQP